MKTENVGDAVLETWTVEEVAQAFDRDEIVLIDVRTVQEYSFEHIVGALLMPMAFFRPDALPTQEGKRIVLQCGSGARSCKVAEIALAAGLSPLAHMKGGFRAWKQAGLPYTGTEMATGVPTAMNADT